ncbi:hypothetical protein [Marinicrinis sediminis]|uniref:DUF2788 domain-containing protein n=1 Tax=Marinicrinis sediminis TaxID=1652465 RepID=A0ABW5REI9_9BACL
MKTLGLVDITEVSRPLLITLFTMLMLIFSCFSWAIVEAFRKRYKHTVIWAAAGILISLILGILLGTGTVK